MQPGQKLQGVTNPARSLAGENGTFIASQPGTTPLSIVCQEGHSIKSIQTVGLPSAGSPNGVWEIQKLNDNTQVPELGENRDAQYQREPQSRSGRD